MFQLNKLFGLALMALLVNYSNNCFSQVIFYEDFEGNLAANGLPVGMTEIGNSPLIWEVGNSASASSQYVIFPMHSNFAYINDDACSCNMANEIMILPPLDLSLYDSMHLEFDFFSQQYYGSVWDVLVSTNGGINWDTIYTDGNNTFDWTKLSLQLYSYSGQTNVLIAFQFRDMSQWAGGLGIDNIRVKRRSYKDLAIGLPLLDSISGFYQTYFPITGFKVIPQDQISINDLIFGATLNNIGLDTAFDAHIRLNIYREMSPNSFSQVYTDSIYFGVILKDSFVFSSKTMNNLNWCIPGNYMYKYISKQNDIDGDTSNDTLMGRFTISENLWSKVDINPDGSPFSTNNAHILTSISPSFLTTYEWGSMYYVLNGAGKKLDTLTVKVNISNSANTNNIPFQCRIYKIIDSGNGIFSIEDDRILKAIAYDTIFNFTLGSSQIRKLTDFIDVSTSLYFNFEDSALYYISIYQNNQVYPGIYFSNNINGLMYSSQINNHDAFYFTNNQSLSHLNPLISKHSNPIFDWTQESGFSNGEDPSMTIKLGNAPKIIGSVYHDVNQNCQKDSLELGLEQMTVIIQPGNITVSTNSLGIWTIDSLPIGNYTVSFDTAIINWGTACSLQQTFAVNSVNSVTYAPEIGLYSTFQCPYPITSITMPLIRRGFSNQTIYVNSCNRFPSNTVLDSAYTIIELDPNITLQSATIPYTTIGNNRFLFYHGDINPGNCIPFNLTVSVGLTAVAGQTLCMSAELYPQPPCVFDTIETAYLNSPLGSVSSCPGAWDGSNLTVRAECSNDSVRFVINNIGNPGTADMNCFSPVYFYQNANWYLMDSVRLNGGDSMLYVFPGSNITWRVDVSQHPYYPGNSRPNASIERCGIGIWTPGLINVLPEDDADPFIDIFCGTIIAPFDPNDKTGFPLGIGDSNMVSQNQDIEYLIRFQNVGTDTAFNVVVRDTLSDNFDIFSVQSLVASHSHDFRIYGNRILEWTFSNIRLADSTTNEPASHGFIKFKVKQKRDLAVGSLLNNSAAIYFDFESPVITNTYTHYIENFNANTVATIISRKEPTFVKVIPNPMSASATFILEGFSNEVSCVFELFDINGRLLRRIPEMINNQFTLEKGELTPGIYFYKITQNEKYNSGKLIIK
jgi:uncharacterized repeat protein (TIGR01451 family)